MTNKIKIKCLPPLTTSNQITNRTYRRTKSNSEYQQYIFQCSYTKEEKHCTFFGQYTWRDENETSNFPGRIQLKIFPGAKANQLSHYVVPTLQEFNYDCAIIRLGINDILRSKDMSELKDLPKKIMQIATTCQCFKIGKVC